MSVISISYEICELAMMRWPECSVSNCQCTTVCLPQPSHEVYEFVGSPLWLQWPSLRFPVMASLRLRAWMDPDKGGEMHQTVDNSLSALRAYENNVFIMWLYCGHRMNRIGLPFFFPWSKLEAFVMYSSQVVWQSLLVMSDKVSVQR